MTSGQRSRRVVQLSLLCLSFFPFALNPTHAAILVWRPAAQGSIENLASGGNRSGLPADAFSLFQNPAGSSLTLNGLDLSVSRNQAWDPSLAVSGNTDPQTTQNPSKGFWTTALGGKVGDFGFSLGSWTPFKGYINNQSLSLRENQFGGSYWLQDLKTSIGFSIHQRSAIWEDINEAIFIQSDHQWSWGMGTLTLLPERWFVGAHFQPETRISSQSELQTPGRLSLGIGTWPNRYFRAHCGSMVYFATGLNGARIQPSCGASYQAFELKATRGWFHAGSYFEPAMGAQALNRLHLTAGFDIHFSFLIFASGIDIANNITSGSFSIGINIDRLGKALGYLPQGLTPPPAGILPAMTHFEDDWMPTHLQMHPEDALQEIAPDLENFEESVRELPKFWQIPGRLKKGIEIEEKEIRDDLEKATDDDLTSDR